jgi:hypothetical protein
MEIKGEKSTMKIREKCRREKNKGEKNMRDRNIEICKIHHKRKGYENIKNMENRKI